MIKKLTLIAMCLILLTSCGRKNDPKYEASLNYNILKFNSVIKVFKMPKKDEIYQ